jgi:hypothetical protein
MTELQKRKTKMASVYPEERTMPVKSLRLSLNTLIYQELVLQFTTDIVNFVL